MPVENTLTTAAGRGLDLRTRFGHVRASDRLDLLPQRVRRAVEQLPVKLLHSGDPGRTLGQSLLGRRQKSPCSVITNVSFPNTTVTQSGVWPVRLFLESEAPPGQSAALPLN